MKPLRITKARIAFVIALMPILLPALYVFNAGVMIFCVHRLGFSKRMLWVFTPLDSVPWWPFEYWWSEYANWWWHL